MKTKIENILKEVLPENVFLMVWERKSIFKEQQIGIAFAASNYDINRVKDQKPQMVSLLLDLQSMELHPQIFGGNGGQCIYRKPDMNHPREKYLAMQSIKIPFRTPKKEEKFVLTAIRRFAENWLKALKENKEVLMYQDIVNYNEII